MSSITPLHSSSLKPHRNMYIFMVFWTTMFSSHYVLMHFWLLLLLAMRGDSRALQCVNSQSTTVYSLEKEIGLSLHKTQRCCFYIVVPCKFVFVQSLQNMCVSFYTGVSMFSFVSSLCSCVCNVHVCAHKILHIRTIQHVVNYQLLLNDKS